MHNELTAKEAFAIAERANKTLPEIFYMPLTDKKFREVEFSAGSMPEAKEIYVSISGRRDNIRDIMGKVALFGRMAARYYIYSQDKKHGGGELCWREREQMEVQSTPHVMFYHEDGPDYDGIKGQKCYMDYGAFTAKYYARLIFVPSRGSGVDDLLAEQPDKKRSILDVTRMFG